MNRCQNCFATLSLRHPKETRHKMAKSVSPEARLELAALGSHNFLKDVVLKN